VRFTSSKLLKNNQSSNTTEPDRSKDQRQTTHACLESLRISRTITISASSRLLVELNGIEPMTSCLQSRRSPN
jgi:hypothetical protein